MELIRKFNEGIRFLLCVIDIFSKYARVFPLKDKKCVSIVNAFQKVLNKSDPKPSKTWVDRSSELFNNSFKKWLNDNDIEMYSTHNEGKSVFAERFIRTLKNKIYKYMTAASKNVYIDKLEDIVDEQNSIYHKTIILKPIDVKDNLTLIKMLMIKILNLKLVIMLEYENTKTFLLKDILQIGLKNVL